MMYEYMYLYKGNIERIIGNLTKVYAEIYIHNLYKDGLIDTKEKYILLKLIERLEKIRKGGDTT